MTGAPKISIRNNINLTWYQKDILYSEKRFTVTEAGTKTGKTHSHLFWLFEIAHGKNPIHYTNSVEEGWEFWWVAPVYGQAKIAFKRLKKKLKGNKEYRVNKSELTITTPLGTIIAFKSAKDDDNLFGENVYACVFDEFTRAKEAAWHALRSTLTHTKGPCKFIGNYKGKSNWGHKLGLKAVKGSQYEYFSVTAMDAVEAGILDQEEVDQARKDLPKVVFDALYMVTGDIDDGLLFDINKIRDSFTNTVEEGKDKYLTCDLAGYGSDRFVVTYWKGWVVKKIYSFDKMEPDAVEMKIKELAESLKVPRSNICYDADGLGTYLRGYLKNARPFINGSKVITQKGVKENYQHLKAQCWFVLSKIFEENKIRIEDENFHDDIERELEIIRRVVKEGKLNIISKKKIKAILGYSPDIADTLMMRVLFHLKASSSGYRYAK